ARRAAGSRVSEGTPTVYVLGGPETAPQTPQAPRRAPNESWRSLGARVSEHALKREHVAPASELERHLSLVSHADELVALVQAQGGLVVGHDARDHRMMAAASCAVDELVENEAAESLAAPAVLHVHGVLRGARI